ncbi:2-phospho-L-lactate guanylyltransferase [Intrasporangium sp.]|uniref:2-phospho-L-lactate guanylyltransferase n=1 Tax=Intrasporangium sp. TaxID=1925024 RepID=UPI002939E638|nr:2-phospho-L-lactate guanylyltransferase [Intrasporangium sp.]MDV3222819.1 2-phospho-L-lactate guanylyltransferase [Intrasporangium sp.]
MNEPQHENATHRKPGWHLVVPVNDAAIGKSRLARALHRAGPGRERIDLEEISRALARDTLHAACEALGPERVVLVTADELTAAEWRARGVTSVRDPGAGLNAAVALGLTMTLTMTPPGAGVAALLGDLPALQPADLEEALEAAARHAQSFVPDADGSGTVLRAAVGQDGHFTPRFGPHSAARHAADGAARLDLDLPRLRTDVDDLESLLTVLRLGAGPSTVAAVAAVDRLDLLGWAHAGLGPRL